MDAFRRDFHEHTASDERHFQDISGKLSTMKDNHLFHIEKSMAQMVEGISDLHKKVDENTKETIENKTNIGWIVKIGGGAWSAVLILIAAGVYIIREAITK